MKPPYLNSLKAGIKTAVITFITAMVGVVTSLMSAAQSWANTGNPPDLSVLRGTAVAAVLALVIGVGNVGLRFIQAGAVPLLGTALDKIIGVIPDYLPPPESPVDAIGEDHPGLNRDADKDQGQSAPAWLWYVVGLAILILVIILIIQNVDIKDSLGQRFLL